MAKIDVLDILRAKRQSPLEFDFDSLWIPPMNYYLTKDDIDSLHHIATSIRLSSKIETKYKMIDDIMRARGFKRFSAGTNRVVYSFLEDTRFLAKIAVDKVGMQDNPMEYQNQFLLKPYVTKMFCISECGTVGFAERVLPIKNKSEFKEIAPDVFDILVNRILGKYVVEDVGTKFFMNWGVRIGSGPVLLDYPYVYKLDGKKLFCNKLINSTAKEYCNGEIDYDSGFNHLVCTRCGKIYLASDLRDNSADNKIIIKGGGVQMKVLLKKGDEIISRSVPSDEVIRPKASKPSYENKGVVVKIVTPSGQQYSNVAKKVENKTEGSIYKGIAANSQSPDDDYSHVVLAHQRKDSDASSETDKTSEVTESTKQVSADDAVDNSDNVNEEDQNETDTSNSEEASTGEDDAEDEDTSEIENQDDKFSKYDAYDDNEDSYREPIRKNNKMRDSSGRFISTSSSKSQKKPQRKTSTFIPNK